MAAAAPVGFVSFREYDSLPLEEHAICSFCATIINENFFGHANPTRRDSHNFHGICLWLNWHELDGGDEEKAVCPTCDKRADADSWVSVKSFVEKTIDNPAKKKLYEALETVEGKDLSDGSKRELIQRIIIQDFSLVSASLCSEVALKALGLQGDAPLRRLLLEEMLLTRRSLSIEGRSALMKGG